MEQMHLIVYKFSGITRQREAILSDFKTNSFSENSQVLYHKKTKQRKLQEES